MTLPLEAKKCLMNERKFQQQEGGKTKSPSALNNSIAVSNDKETSKA
jgi:hypothetical protein